MKTINNIVPGKNGIEMPNKPFLREDFNNRAVSSAYVDNNPFDVSEAMLGRGGYNLINLEENAWIRVQKGLLDGEISRKGNFVSEAFVSRSGDVFLSKYSPISNNPAIATDCNRKGQDFQFNDEQFQRVFESSILLPTSKRLSIPTNRLGEDKVSCFMFGEIAQKYGEMLHQLGIERISVLRSPVNNQNSVRQAILWGTNRNEVDGTVRLFHPCVRVRGIKYLDQAEELN